MFYLGNIISLLMFVSSSKFLVLVASRILIGFFKILLMIFIPVWGDAFGDEKQKSKWMTLYMITAPMGVVIGYSLTAVFMKFSTWYYAFFFEIVLFVPFTLYHLYTPEKYSNLQKGLRNKKQSEKIEKLKEQNAQSFRKQKNAIDLLNQNSNKKSITTLESNFDQNLIDDDNDMQGQTEEDFDNEDAVSVRSRESNISDVSEVPERTREQAKAESQLMKQRVVSLLTNKKYILLALTLTNLYFVVSGIQYWITKYLQVVLNVEETVAQTFFSLTCLTAPVSGVIIGGSITTYFGGF